MAEGVTSTEDRGPPAGHVVTQVISAQRTWSCNGVGCLLKRVRVGHPPFFFGRRGYLRQHCGDVMQLSVLKRLSWNVI